MSRLSICVPHYKEPWEVCHYLFDSIALQQGIDFNDVEVVLVNDGTEGVLSVNELEHYPYRIRYFVDEKSNVSKTRNAAMQYAQGEYVMWCDADDMFVSNYGLHLVFSAMQEEPNVITSVFVEEQKDENGNYKLIRHEKDATFVHGKVYKKQYLIDEKLQFDESLYIHEDGYFNSIALVCANGSVKRIETPFYMWKWNDKSVVRENPVDYVIRTYDHLMKCRVAMAEELKKRGRENDFKDCIAKTICDSYYDFCKPSYLTRDNKDAVLNARKAFKEFYMKYIDEFKKVSLKRLAEIMMISRNNAYANGLICESWTLMQFLKMIEETK